SSRRARSSSSSRWRSRRESSWRASCGATPTSPPTTASRSSSTRTGTGGTATTSRRTRTARASAASWPRSRTRRSTGTPSGTCAGTRRELTPYAAGAVEHRDGADRTSILGKAGFDFRYGLSSSVEADLTVNTDFAETEADQQQFNFGRSSLFFPEKRTFFLQRAQIFDFGSAHTTLPFFSGTIGLNSTGDVAVPIPIDACSNST